MSAPRTRGNAHASTCMQPQAPANHIGNVCYAECSTLHVGRQRTGVFAMASQKLDKSTPEETWR